MTSGAEPQTVLLPRGAALFDRIDYRLIETPEDRDNLYLMRYRAYLPVRLAFVACDHFNADTGLAMIRTDHQAFYRRIFLHETISPEPRGFPGWPTKKAVLMASDFRNQREKVLTRFPIMRSSAFE